MYLISPESTFTQLLNLNRAYAAANIAGSNEQPQLNGSVKFFQTPYDGILIQAEIFGLPDSSKDSLSNFYAMHIHETGNCNPPFDETGAHYNPDNKPHPYHAGDLVSLLSNRGYAYGVFFDTRFKIDDVIGMSVIIHSGTDDFTSQPSGNSGDKIGCGVIIRI